MSYLDQRAKDLFPEIQEVIRRAKKPLTQDDIRFRLTQKHYGHTLSIKACEYYTSIDMPTRAVMLWGISHGMLTMNDNCTYEKGSDWDLFL